MAKLYPNGYPYNAFQMIGIANKDRVSTLAKNIRALRKSNNLTQAQFAMKVQEKAGRYTRFGGRKGQSLVSQYERQVCSPKIDNVIAICQTFNINPVELCGYDISERMKLAIHSARSGRLAA